MFTPAPEGSHYVYHATGFITIDGKQIEIVLRSQHVFVDMALILNKNDDKEDQNYSNMRVPIVNLSDLKFIGNFDKKNPKFLVTVPVLGRLRMKYSKNYFGEIQVTQETQVELIDGWICDTPCPPASEASLDIPGSKILRLINVNDYLNFVQKQISNYPFNYKYLGKLIPVCIEDDDCSVKIFYDK